MSKTETQTEAQKLSALLAVAMAFEHGRIGTDRRFVEMDTTMAASIDAELRRLDAEVRELKMMVQHESLCVEAAKEHIEALELAAKAEGPSAEQAHNDLIKAIGAVSDELNRLGIYLTWPAIKNLLRIAEKAKSHCAREREESNAR